MYITNQTFTINYIKRIRGFISSKCCNRCDVEENSRRQKKIKKKKEKNNFFGHGRYAGYLFIRDIWLRALNCEPFCTFFSSSLSPFFILSRESLFLSISSLAWFAMHALLEDTRRSSYAHARVYTPCTSQISTLREHTNKPHVYPVRPTCLHGVSFVLPLLLFLWSSRSLILCNLTDFYHSLTFLTRGVLSWEKTSKIFEWRITAKK